MKILICSWNDADTIRRTLDSVKNHEVHLFDGRFNDFPGEGWESMDGTLEIAAEHLNVTIHAAVPDETQCQKRTRMFSVLAPGEYGMKLDGDEILLSKLPELTDAKDVYWAWAISNAYDYPYMKPIIFKQQPGMHYAGKHHYLFDGNRKLISSDQHMGSRYEHSNLDVRVFNIRDRNPQRDRNKLRFISHRAELRVADEHSVYGEQEMRLQEHRALRPRRSVDIVMTPKPTQITLGATFSRPWAFKRFVLNLDNVLLPVPCEIVAVVDHSSRRFYREVQRALEQRAERFPSGIRTYFTGNPPPHEKKRVHERRLRISKALHVILTEAHGEILLGAEDDSLPQADAYMRLLEHLKRADFAQGTIVGRWEPIIPAWQVTERNGIVEQVRTGEKTTGVEEIQGVGWYCFAAKTDAMRAVPINWDVCKHLGPDFHMGYYMWKAGYRLVHDHDVHVTHFGEDFELNLNASTIVRRWDKVGKLWQAQ